VDLDAGDPQIGDGFTSGVQCGGDGSASADRVKEVSAVKHGLGLKVQLQFKWHRPGGTGSERQPESRIAKTAVGADAVHVGAEVDVTTVWTI